ncbi:DUF1097 domain-containing protein [Ferrimonas balearica]|uniref:DUF1097 domain-containing protein n=1 Tax=Ferrimonas balearica TaxID=44012 RepID=UPI001C99432E|nr:DUF1097 domain-containing protein [Ferrimonas balearica]MBY5991275.1 DUF1097 domain-containing protein [Ferrimonas balearica]
MSALVAIAITTGLLSALWGWLSIALGLLTWAGFLGCTSYFASSDDSLKGLGVSLASNLSGVLWGLSLIHGSQWLEHPMLGYLLTGVVAFIMCVQSRQRWLTFIPGTFIGCCATFAAEGHWQLVVPSLLLGGLFGYLMKRSGLWLKARADGRAPAADPARQGG